jgi:1,4-dihydroxy-2-naphthoyl-CoA hydrolase
MDVVEKIHARFKGLLPDTLAMQITHADADCVRAELTVRDAICTTGGILHGGAIMAYADTLGAVGTVLNIPESAGTATIESKTNFFRPAPVNTVVSAECTPVNKGRRTQTWQTRLLNADGKVIALVTQTQMVL